MKILKQSLLIIIMTIFVIGGIWLGARPAISSEMSERLQGRILLQVEQNGESWYVYPPTQHKFYLGRPTDAFDIMRNQGLGITTADLNKIPRYGMDDMGDLAMQERLAGYILLQVELNGEAWYVDPSDLQRHFLGRPTDAFDIMRNLGLGISDNDLDMITTDENSMDLITDNPNSNTNTNINENTVDETPPVLTKFIVDFGPFNSETETAGDFDFNNGREKVFGDFGRTVTGPEGDKILPSYDVFVVPNTSIESPLAGIVENIIYQETGDDYEIHIRSNENSIWTISLDHVTDLSAYINEGATVTAGQYIGQAAAWSGTYLTELMIFKSVNNGAQAYCPYNFFSSSLKASFETNLNTLMSDWETYKGDSSIYDEASQVQPGCLTESEGA